MSARKVNPHIVEYDDDNADGFVLRIVRGNDGDFHVTVAPNADKLLEVSPDWHRASVRVCSYQGGGRHERLYRALAELWRAEGMYDEQPHTTAE